ncbi:Site-specific recombinase XerD [Flaviramulus basaltis]|uniref:Site-specific recombinase XerD n=1 Tax=Flaviramulus basaltis TaxID=369401 RepID=A0A1K2IRB3_9FLAO|nr:site-specific integrase [Flaviramulus basaltis]SFZ94911.1 Site-specific recombinase XerD [Flaviramulus basaltis]
MGSFFDILQTAYSTAYKHGVEKKFIEPRIYHGGKNFDLSKRWYVYYSYQHLTKRDKHGNPVMERRPPITLKVNQRFKTKEERLFHFGLIRDVLHAMLKDGYSPHKDELNFDAQSLEYTAKDALDFAYTLKTKTLSETSIPDYRSRYNQFKGYLEKKNLLEKSILSINKKNVIEYLNGIVATSSARNRNNTRIVLSSLFGLLKDNDIIPDNFMDSINVLNTKSVSHQTYSLDILEGLFAFMKKNDPLLLLFVKFVSYNFLRPIEVCRLQVKDIFLSQKLLRFRAKNKPEKTKIIPDIVLSQLIGLDFSTPDYFLFTPNGIGSWEIKESYKRDYFSKRFKKIKEKYNKYLLEQGETFELGSEYTVYSFRHTFITLLFRKFRKELSYTQACDKLMLITGHSTLKALKAYLRDIDAELPEDYSGFLDLNT